MKLNEIKRIDEVATAMLPPTFEVMIDDFKKAVGGKGSLKMGGSISVKTPQAAKKLIDYLKKTIPRAKGILLTSKDTQFLFTEVFKGSRSIPSSFDGMMRNEKEDRGRRIGIRFKVPDPKKGMWKDGAFEFATDIFGKDWEITLIV